MSTDEPVLKLQTQKVYLATDNLDLINAQLAALYEAEDKLVRAREALLRKQVEGNARQSYRAHEALLAQRFSEDEYVSLQIRMAEREGGS